MTKEDLLKELEANTWVMLKPSPIEGIGVFALRDIPKGCRDMFNPPHENDSWISISKEEVAALPAHSKFLVQNYCLYDDDHYFIPGEGFKKMDLVFFLNHSDTPNIISVNEGDFFETLRDIKAGEELLVDYGEIVDGE